MVGVVSGIPMLSIMIGLPLVAGAIALFQSANGARWTALLATLANFALGIALWAALVGRKGNGRSAGG